MEGHAMKAIKAFIDTDNAITVGIYSQAYKKRENNRKGNLFLSAKLQIHTKFIVVIHHQSK